jgi:hypothetical protein
MVHNPHMVIEKAERERFTGTLEFIFKAGSLVKLMRTESIQLGPRKAVWPPAGRETRIAPLQQGAPVGGQKEAA